MDGNNAALHTFLESFDNGDGIAAIEGNFFVSDGEKLKEVGIEGSDITGKVNR